MTGQKIQGILLIACFCMIIVLISGCTGNATGKTTPSADPTYNNWNLTLNGTTEKVLTLPDLQALPAVTANGYAVSTTGIRFGPYTCKGVDLRDLTALVGGVGEKDQVWVYAPDGYLWVFDAGQLNGTGFVTFNESLREVPAPPLKVILMYGQDGKPVPYNDGGPVRIAIVSDSPGIVTEGSAWVKWVDRIEVHKK
jgi:DMSO/TMAO reductase YedYZ molybdopterin-dependent catalytic subunit